MLDCLVCQDLEENQALVDHLECREETEPRVTKAIVVFKVYLVQKVAKEMLVVQVYQA